MSGVPRSVNINRFRLYSNQENESKETGAASMLKAEVGEELDRSRIPQIIFERHPEYVELYGKAWELAADHIYHNPGMPSPRYMGEGCNCGRIWIWDTCFMALFCKYSAGYFPGMESLENLYRPIHDSVPSDCRIHHVDI